MSVRHYIYIINKKSGKEEYSSQILGNNDYFDKDFYKKFGLQISQDGCIEKSTINRTILNNDKYEIDFVEFFTYWRIWIDRKENRRTIGKLRQLETIPPDYREEYIYNDLIYGNYYVIQPFSIMKEINDKKFLTDDLINKNLKKEYKFYISIY